MGRPFKCPYCGSTDNVRKGFRKTKSMGLRKIQRCKNCRRKFTPRNQQGNLESDIQAVPNQAAYTSESNASDMSPTEDEERPQTEAVLLIP